MPFFLLKPLIVNVRSKILKTGIFPQKGQAAAANRAITLFGDNDFSGTFFGGFGVVDLIAVDKDDNICILLDGLVQSDQTLPLLRPVR